MLKALTNIKSLGLIFLILCIIIGIFLLANDNQEPFPVTPTVLTQDYNLNLDSTQIPANVTRAPPLQVKPSASAQTNISITDITDNRHAYSGGKIPQYEKFELTFQILNTVAQKFQFPYDPSPPNGVDLTISDYQGISVDAHFTPDEWQTIYKQPAFYFQHFDGDIKSSWDDQDREWFHPTDDFAWKVRFSPNQVGTWHYKLVAQDASGFTESKPISFDVLESANPGFIKVSQSDNRYFEYDNGVLFYPLGVQGISPLNAPSLGRESTYQTYNQNGINFERIWISEIYGTAWLEWIGGRNLYNDYLPRPGISPFFDPVRERFSLTQVIDYEPDGNTGWFDACRFQFSHDVEAIKPDTIYRLLIKYWGKDIDGPRQIDHPEYGLVGKIGGGWEVDCFEPGTSFIVTNYGHNTTDWNYLEGTWNSGDFNFLPRIYIGLENVTQGRGFIDSISLQEVLSDGQYGPEILAEPSMQYELYFPEQNAYKLDRLVELAEQYSVNLKVVIHEKNDVVFTKLKDDGAYVYHEDDNLDGFYGVGREINKTRWLQQAWWRYLQARWGYSTAIHSWELTNEGDPWNNNHWALADELGKYMHCQVFDISVGVGDGEICLYEHPNAHLVTTSFWRAFPGEMFWGNADYPNIDYADVHAYISTGWMEKSEYESDTALFHLDYSAEVRRNLDYYASQNGLESKPVMRGETGIDFLGEQRENPDLALDVNGVWLHNLIWASLDPGGMTELYWWTENIKNQPGPDGQRGLYEIFGFFQDFVENIPLANGSYQNAEATLTDLDLRVTGQKDLVNGRAHLWVQNKNHTWRNVVDGVDNVGGLASIVKIEGFTPNTTFGVEWHQFYSNGKPIINNTSTSTDETGNIVMNLPVDPLITDVGIKIGDYSQSGQ